MTLKEFADMLSGREYGLEISKEEELLAKYLGFVVVFGYSDDNAELRGAINDEIGCFGGGSLRHKDLPAEIRAEWCPANKECSWAYSTVLPYETFNIYEGGELYCVGIVCDINKPKLTNGEWIRSMSDNELIEVIGHNSLCNWVQGESGSWCHDHNCTDCLQEWLRQPAEEESQ